MDPSIKRAYVALQQLAARAAYAPAPPTEIDLEAIYEALDQLAGGVPLTEPHTAQVATPVDICGAN